MFLFMPRDGFRYSEGAPKQFARSDLERAVTREFCAECGTPLTYEGLGTGRVSVTLGSLDDPNAVEPEAQLGVESRLAWLAHGLAAPEMRTEQWLAKAKITAVDNRQHPDRET